MEVDETAPPRCIICEEDEPAPATAACKDCKIYLCDFDALMHKGTPSTMSHDMIRLKPLFCYTPPDTGSTITAPHSPVQSISPLPHPPVLISKANNNTFFSKEMKENGHLPTRYNNHNHNHHHRHNINHDDDQDSSENEKSHSTVQERDEEAFINFVKEFKYIRGDTSTPSPSNSDGHADDAESQDLLRVKRVKKNNNYEDTLLYIGSSEETKNWELYYEKLAEYKGKYGNCYVPYDWVDDPPFAQWVSRQRVFKNKGKLPLDRIERLDSLGFTWSANEAGAFKMRWEQRLDELRQYKEAHGSCAVPYRWPKNTQLANWVFRQREHRKAGKLSDDRIVQLDDVGFLWGVDISVSKDSRWELKFTELKEFKVQNGHCRVPNAYRVNQQLANWVRKQRELRKKGRLTRDRIERLDECGFVWEIGQGKPSRYKQPNSTQQAHKSQAL